MSTKLAYLKSQYCNLAPQGSEAWLQSRRTKIGGSEVAAAIGKSPYQKPKQLTDNKKSMARIRAAPCTFGHMFEPLAKTIIEQELRTEIHELGAVPSSRYPICYSPDGLVVQKVKSSKTAKSKHQESEELNLIEIKCPFRRSRLDTVPDHYLCQVLTGMCVLPCEKTLFYQFRFRICRQKDIGPSEKYNRWLHVEAYKRCPDVKPLRWGFMHFPGPLRLQDLGALRKENADDLCDFQRREREVFWESKDYPKTGYVMGFKLFDMSCVEVPRQPAFLDEHADTLWKIHSTLTEQTED